MGTRNDNTNYVWIGRNEEPGPSLAGRSHMNKGCPLETAYYAFKKWSEENANVVLE